MLAVPPAATVLRAVASVSSVAKARRAAPRPTADPTLAVETPPIARAVALVGEVALLEAPAVMVVAMQASAELVQARDAMTEVARAAHIGPAGEVLPTQTQPVPTDQASENAKAAQAAIRASAAPMKLALRVAVATKAIRAVPRKLVVKSALGDLASANAPNAATRANRHVGPAVKGATRGEARV